MVKPRGVERRWWSECFEELDHDVYEPAQYHCPVTQHTQTHGSSLVLSDLDTHTA